MIKKKKKKIFLKSIDRTTLGVGEERKKWLIIFKKMILNEGAVLLFALLISKSAKDICRYKKKKIKNKFHKIYAFKMKPS